MDNTRNSISKLISELRLTEALWDQLKPTTLERVVAELTVQNSALLEFSRATQSSDFILRMQDELGYLRTVAMEVKQFTRPLGIEAIEQFRKSIEQLNVDRSILVTSSYFTEEAKQLSQQYAHLLLVDRSGLRSWIEEYTREREHFLSTLFETVWNLDITPTIEIPNPSASQVEGIKPTEAGLGPEQESALVSVDSLPLHLIARILRAPHEVKNLSPRQFEEFIAETLSQLGFTDVILTPRSRDGGKDVIASHKVNNIPLSFYFECKHYAEGNKVQLETLRALLGTLAHDAQTVNKGVLVTTSTFTKGAREFILGEARLDGKDYNGILGWVDELKKKIGDG